MGTLNRRISNADNCSLVHLITTRICFTLETEVVIYCNNPKYWDRHTLVNTADPDQ